MKGRREEKPAHHVGIHGVGGPARSVCFSCQRYNATLAFFLSRAFLFFLLFAAFISVAAVASAIPVAARPRCTSIAFSIAPPPRPATTLVLGERQRERARSIDANSRRQLRKLFTGARSRRGCTASGVYQCAPRARTHFRLSVSPHPMESRSKKQNATRFQNKRT